MPFLVSTLNYNWKSILVAFSVALFSIFESKTNKNSLIYAIYVCFCLFFHKFDPYSSKSRTFMPFLGSTLNSKSKNIAVAFFVAPFLVFESKNSLKKCHLWLFFLVFLIFRPNMVNYIQFWCHFWNLHSILGGKNTLVAFLVASFSIFVSLITKKNL